MELRRGARLAVAVVALSLPAAAALAEPAEDLLQEAVLRFRLARFKQSLQLLERARRRARDPQVLGRIQLGINHAVMVRAAEARAAFRAALVASPALELDPRRFKQSIVEHFQEAKRGLRGQLEVTGGEPGAQVLLDGARLGDTPWSGAVGVGRHALVVRSRDGRRGHAEEILVAASDKTRVVARLVKLQGKLTITTTPPGAAILLDGKPLGVTPLEGATLDAGRHQLALRLAGYRDELLALVIGAGETRSLRRTLALLRAPVAATPPRAPGPTPSERRSSARVLKWVALGTAVGCLAAGIALLALHGKGSCGDAGEQLCPDSYDTRLPGALLTGAGGLAAAGSGFFFYWDHRR
jgi:hypothetical protein